MDNIDVFCEKNVFDVEASRRILRAGQKAGWKVNFHGDELHPTCSAEVTGGERGRGDGGEGGEGRRGVMGGSAEVMGGRGRGGVMGRGRGGRGVVVHVLVDSTIFFSFFTSFQMGFA